jgi:hypothetical protein
MAFVQVCSADHAVWRPASSGAILVICRIHSHRESRDVLEPLADLK